MLGAQTNYTLQIIAQLIVLLRGASIMKGQAPLTVRAATMTPSLKPLL